MGALKCQLASQQKLSITKYKNTLFAPTNTRENDLVHTYLYLLSAMTTTTLIESRQ